MTEMTLEDVLEVCLELAEPVGRVTMQESGPQGMRDGSAISTQGIADAASGSQLILPGNTFQRIAAALTHSNVRLIGPPGTGKSTLAKAVLDAAVGDRHSFAVATGQWTGDDVIGGPIPDPRDAMSLVFQPGLVLAAAEQGKWVCIDEINRADIDAAFGELFGLLAGFDLELPYHAEAGSEKRVRIYAERPAGVLESGEYGLPPGWRMIATMNSWDKLSLNRVSFAFSRRWCTVFLPVPAPSDFEAILDQLWAQFLPEGPEALKAALYYLFVSDVDDDGPTLRTIGMSMGPGIARSCLLDIAAMITAGISPGGALAYALEGFLLPQFEGALEQHDALTRALRAALALVSAPSELVDELEGKLAVFTGRRVSTRF
ncbi:MAG TPA: AAA family ATPase [Jatrophihabitans sp.]|jgi:hypothetical protein|uniref:AAA family ATPase n=1 Tax=Jatrophihabitans sp. TaxID=1932789 RepID=UPI002EF74A1D